MFKELVISIVIICSIFGLNSITEKYTTDVIEKMKSEFDIIREKLVNNEETQNNILNEKVENLISDWQEYDEKLSYYIEHDELEKVETYLVSLKSNIEMEEYEQAVENLDVCVYILDHIDDKEAFLIRNIF